MFVIPSFFNRMMAAWLRNCFVRVICSLSSRTSGATTVLYPPRQTRYHEVCLAAIILVGAIARLDEHDIRCQVCDAMISIT